MLEKKPGKEKKKKKMRPAGRMRGGEVTLTESERGKAQGWKRKERRDGDEHTDT